jgi:hypothetical protein
MTAKFIGNGNGLSLRCNHGDVHMGEQRAVDSDGNPAVDDQGSPLFERVFPPKCDEKIVTGQILRSGIRAYAKTQKWLTVEIDGRQRDFCPAHGQVRVKWIKERKAQADAIKAEKKAAREKADAERRQAWADKQAAWKRRREEREASKRERAAARAAKAA